MYTERSHEAALSLGRHFFRGKSFLWMDNDGGKDTWDKDWDWDGKRKRTGIRDTTFGTFA